MGNDAKIPLWHHRNNNDEDEPRNLWGLYTQNVNQKQPDETVYDTNTGAIAEVLE